MSVESVSEQTFEKVVEWFLRTYPGLVIEMQRDLVRALSKSPAEYETMRILQQGMIFGMWLAETRLRTESNVSYGTTTIQ